MGLFRKKADPISARARALNSRISALEVRIKRLNQQLQAGQGPRLRSTVYPAGQGATPKSPRAPAPAANEPIFEEVGKLGDTSESAATPQHFNELGVRKFDLLDVWRRIKKQFGGRPLADHKLINYLAAGSIEGMRTLRYEKSIARKRFFFLAGSVGLLLLGFFLWLFANRP
jgi:hypothetical protein